jgi:hypothetical protein
MFRFSWIAAAMMICASPALAGGNSIAIEISNDREPHDFDVSKDMKYEVSGTHRFENGVFLGGLFQYTDPASGGEDSQNLEASVGYRLPLDRSWSLDGSVALGGRFEQGSSDFAYYALRVGASVRLFDWLTWTVVSYRYRNAFDTDNDYDTPELSTGMAFKVSRANQVTARLYREWKDGSPDDTGLALGFRHDF